VEDWGEAEDQRMVFSQVPPEFPPKILAETGKRRNGKKWVRVSVPNESLVGEVQAIIQDEVGFPLRIVGHEKRHFVVACADDGQVRELLEIDGSKLSGQVIRVQRAAYSMSGDEIFAFVRRHLEQDEELRSMQADYLAGPGRAREVRAVLSDPPVVVEKEPKQDQKKKGKWDRPHKKIVKAEVKGKSQSQSAKASPRAQSPKGDRPSYPNFIPGECFDCSQAGKDPKHDFKTCQFHLDKLAQRRAKGGADGSRSPRGSPSANPPRRSAE
jgi:hypothetical protein